MAIALDAASSSSGTGTSLTWSHTTGSGSDRVLWVAVNINLGGDGDPVTGVTYNGVAMTQIVKRTTGGGGGAGCNPAYLYYLAAPASGTHDIVVSCGSSQPIYGTGVSYTGASQSGADSSAGGYFPNTSSATQNTTVVASNCWLISVGGESNAGTPLLSAPMVTRGSNTFEGVTGDSNGTVGTGTQGATYTHAGSSSFTIVVASFGEAVAPSGPTNVKEWDGVTQSTGVKEYFGTALASVKSVNGVT